MIKNIKILICQFYQRISQSIRVNKIATNFSLWFLLTSVQIAHAKYISNDDNDFSKLILKNFNVDWYVGLLLLAVGIFLYFIATKINKNNSEDQSKSQNLIENELSSAAMNIGGSFILYANTIFWTSQNSSLALMYIALAIAIYVASWFLLPD
jgi:hypothetical protein